MNDPTPLTLTSKNKLSIHSLFLPVSLVIYLFFAIYKLEDYPFFFFCDEAVIGVEAQRLIDTGADLHNRKFPVFFEGLGNYAQGFAVYAQVPFNLIFGNTLFSIRLRSIFFSLLAVYFIYLLLKEYFTDRFKNSWSIPLILISTPFWFLHSRLGFECLQAASLYLGFVAFYIRAVNHNEIKSGLLAAVCWSTAFYTYAPARSWVIFSLAAFIVLSPKLHLQNKKAAGSFLIMTLLLLAPYLYFYSLSPGQANKRLYQMGYEGFIKSTVQHKISVISANYSKLLDPGFWFFRSYNIGSSHITRHVIPDLAFIPAFFIPFFLAGLVKIITGYKKLANRYLLAALIISPLVVCCFEVTIFRVMNIGLLLLVITIIGLEELLELPSKLSPIAAKSAVLLVLAVYIIFFANYSFNISKYNYDNRFGFRGLQSGAKPLYEYIIGNPGNTFIVDGDLFNATSIFSEFFLNEQEKKRVSIKPVKSICKLPFNPQDNLLIAAYPALINQLSASGCPITFEIAGKIYDPLGNVLIQLYKATVPQSQYQNILNQRHSSMIEESIMNKEGQRLDISHTPFDVGTINNLFDNDKSSLVRTDFINPAIIRIKFQSRILRKVAIYMSNTKKAEFELRAYNQATGKSTTYYGEYDLAEENENRIYFFLDKDTPIDEIEIKVKAKSQDDYANVHINEIKFY